MEYGCLPNWYTFVLQTWRRHTGYPLGAWIMVCWYRLFSHCTTGARVCCTLLVPSRVRGQGCPLSPVLLNQRNDRWLRSDASWECVFGMSNQKRRLCLLACLWMLSIPWRRLEEVPGQVLKNRFRSLSSKQPFSALLVSSFQTLIVFVMNSCTARTIAHIKCSYHIPVDLANVR